MNRKKAILSGGEIGMGRVIALELAENGYDVAFSYYPKTQNLEDALSTTAKLLEERGARSWAFPADFSKKDAPREFFEAAVDAIGGIDLLVNNAGVNIPLPLQDITEKNFDYLVSVDLRAYVMLMHYAAKYMIDHDLQGCIVNISSSRGERAYANAGIYCGIKACLNHMAEAFALDLAPYRIRVNNVAPGAIRVRTDEELLAMTHGRKTDYFFNEDFKTNPKLVGTRISGISLDRGYRWAGSVLRRISEGQSRSSRLKRRPTSQGSRFGWTVASYCRACQRTPPWERRTKVGKNIDHSEGGIAHRHDSPAGLCRDGGLCLCFDAKAAPAGAV